MLAQHQLGRNITNFDCSLIIKTWKYKIETTVKEVPFL